MTLIICNNRILSFCFVSAILCTLPIIFTVPYHNFITCFNFLCGSYIDSTILFHFVRKLGVVSAPLSTGVSNGHDGPTTCTVKHPAVCVACTKCIRGIVTLWISISSVDFSLRYILATVRTNDCVLFECLCCKEPLARISYVTLFHFDS